MQIRGQLTFPGFRQQHNQVTLSGATALAKALAESYPVQITNILYITDSAALEAIKSYVGSNYKELTFQHLFYPDAQGIPNLEAPVYNTDVWASAAGSAWEGKGRISLETLPPTASEAQLSCKVLYGIGSWPYRLDSVPILAMALILNGNPSLPPQFDGTITNQYKPTGEEVLFAFIPISSYLVYSNETDNEFSWNLYISVK